MQSHALQWWIWWYHGCLNRHLKCCLSSIPCEAAARNGTPVGHNPLPAPVLKSDHSWNMSQYSTRSSFNRHHASSGWLSRINDDSIPLVSSRPSHVDFLFCNTSPSSSSSLGLFIVGVQCAGVIACLFPRRGHWPYGRALEDQWAIPISKVGWGDLESGIPERVLDFRSGIVDTNWSGDGDVQHGQKVRAFRLGAIWGDYLGQ